jgi:TP901 family phage tail tape measure protein
VTTAATLSVDVNANVGGAQRGLLSVQKTALGAAAGKAKFAAASAGLAGVGAAVAGVVKTTVDFDKSMRNVNSIAQLNEGQFKKLSASVKDLAGPTAQAPKTLADGLYDLVSSGFDAKESLTILKSSARAATAGLTDTATSTKAVAAVLNAYHRPASAAAQVSDDLFQTVNRGVISFEQLAQNIGDVLPFASALHVGLKEVGAATATMTKAGVSAPETMTRIKGVMSALIKPSDDLKKAYKQLGVESGEGLIKKTGSLQGALQSLARTTGGSKEQLAKLFPDIRALGGALLLTGTNAKTANADLKAFANDSGATGTALKEQAKSVSYAWNKFKATASAAAIDAGSVLVPAMADGAQAVSKFVSEIRSGTGDGGKFAAHVSEVAHSAAEIVGPAASAALSVGKLTAALATTPEGLSWIAGAAAGFGAFKAAGFAAAGVTKLSAAMAGLRANPVSAVALAAGLAVGAIVKLATAESDSEAAARRAAAAQRELADAIDSLHGTERSAVDARNRARASTDRIREGEARLLEMRQQGKQGTAAYRAVENQLSSDRTGHSKDMSDYANSLRKVSAAEDETRTKASTRLKLASDELQKYQGYAARARAEGYTPEDSEKIIGLLAKAQRKYNAAMEEFATANLVANNTELDKQRIANGLQPVLKKNAAAYKFMNALLQQTPKEVRTKYLLTGTQEATQQLADLSVRVIASGKTPAEQVRNQKVVTTILTKSDSAAQAVQAFKAILAGVPAKTVAHVVAITKGAEQVAALKALAAGVPEKKVAHILATTKGKESIDQLRKSANAVPLSKRPKVTASASGKEQIDGVAASMRAVPPSSNREINVTTTYLTIHKDDYRESHRGRALGRGPIGEEVALVGEGRAPEWVGSQASGWKLVSSPTLMHLSAQDSVIPTDPALSGRAAFIAQSAGLSGYAGGRDGKNGPVSQVQTSTNPFTKKRERHTAKEWARIRAEYKRRKDAAKKAKKAKADAAADRLSNPLSLVALDVAAVGVSTAELSGSTAQDPTGTKDNVTALKAQDRAVDARLKALKNALMRKGLKRGDKRRMLSEQASLLGQKSGIASTLKDLAPAASATPAQFAQSNAALASLTPDLNDDVSAAQQLVKAFTDDLNAAKATGDPTKIAEAAQNLKGATDDLKNASDAITAAAEAATDQRIRGFGANVIRAKVSGDKGAEIAAVSSELAAATEAFNAASAASNLDGIEKYGGEVLSLRDDLKTLAEAVNALSETNQALLDLQKQALAEARRALNTSAAEQRAMGKYLVGIVNQQVGQMVGRRSGTPRPLALADY